MTYHICQDDFGFWFASQEFDDGRLEIIGHGGTNDNMWKEAREAQARWGGNILEEAERLPFPEGGLVPGYVPPEPRRVK